MKRPALGMRIKSFFSKGIGRTRPRLVIGAGMYVHGQGNNRECKVSDFLSCFSFSLSIRGEIRHELISSS